MSSSSSSSSSSFGWSQALSASEVGRVRRQHVGSNVSLSYADAAPGPLLLQRGAGCSVWDAAGLRYLDCINNVAHVGHSHPAVVQAAVEQMRLINTNTVRAIGRYRARAAPAACCC